MTDMGKRYPPNNPWNDNPCHGIWIRTSTYKHVSDSWGEWNEGERYWSNPGDYDPERNMVTLRPYAETIHDARRMFAHVRLRPEFVFERFTFIGHGGPG